MSIKNTKQKTQYPEFISKNVDTFGLNDIANHQDTSSSPLMILTCRAEKSHILIDVSLLESSGVYGKTAYIVKAYSSTSLLDTE